MPQMISRNTVLLQGAGRTNIEYSAGPNINITNDVISGRDWSNEIAKGGASAVSSHLSAGDHIDLNTNSGGITTISVTGDFYSAGDNIDITNNVISGKDWTNDIDSHIESAISGKADASAIPEIVDYSAGANIDITDHVISGKDWSYEIGQKADRSEVIERISAASESIVNNLTETISSTSSELYDIISATSGQGGGSCPWISGGKDYGSATVQLNFGDTIPVFSSWDLSGDHNHYIWMKGAYVRLPDGSEFLPNSAFSSYTASMASNMENNWNYTNSAYSMAINNTHNKLDNSAFSAYTAAHSADDVIPYSGANGIDVTDHVISFTGEAGSNYSAGANIDITDNVISGKDWTSEISAASSILNQMIASGDNVAYSAGNNINITNHVVSGKDWTNEIASSTSGKLDSSWTANKDVTPYSAGQNINVTDHVISGKDWTSTIDEHIESAISGIEIPSAKPVSGTSGIKIEETENSVVFSISGDVGKTYSAGSNIYISNQNVISGRDWSTNINSATSGKLDKSWSAGKDVTPYSAGSNINITNHVVSGKDWTSDIDSHIASATSAFITSGDLPAQKELSAGEGISITETENALVIATSGIPSGSIQYSALNWVDYGDQNVVTSIQGQGDYNYIFSARYAGWSDYAGSASYDSIGRPLSSISGKVYTSPSGTILVDNENNRLEASTSGLITTEHITAAGVNQVTGEFSPPDWDRLSGKAITDVVGGTTLKINMPAGDYNRAKWFWGTQSGEYQAGASTYPQVISSYQLTGTSSEAHDLILSGARTYYAIDATAYKYTPGQTAYTTEKVDLYNNYSAGSGISLENHQISLTGQLGKVYTGVSPIYVNNEANLIGVSAAWKLSAGDGVSFTVDEPNSTLTVNAEGGGDANYYVRHTPITSTTAEGDLTIYDAVGQGTPHKIYARIGSADVGLLAPTGAYPESMLITDTTGAVTWTARSAVIPEGYSGTYYKCLVCTEDDGEEALNKMPSTAQDFAYTVINGNTSGWIYYSAGAGTATLNPGEAVTMYWNKDDERLWCTPTDRADGWDDYAYRYEDLGGMKLREVATSAEASADNILYIITGGN